MENLLWGRGSAREALWAEPPWTARRAKVGKAQLGIPAREGERKQDSVGGTWGTSDGERDQTVSLNGASAGRTQNEVSAPLSLQQAFTLCWVPSATTPFIKGHQGHTWWLGNNYHVAGQPDVTGSTALEWDG